MTEAQSAVSKLAQGADYIGAAQMGHINSSRQISNLAGLSWLSPELTAGIQHKQEHLLLIEALSPSKEKTKSGCLSTVVQKSHQLSCHSALKP